MECRIVDEGSKTEWDEFVESNANVVNWHHFDWYKVATRNRGDKYYPIAVYDGARVCGILPIYHVHTLRTGSALFSIPYVALGGIVAETEVAEQLLLNRAIELSHELGSIPVTLKQYRHPIAGDLVTDDGFYNRELTLADDVETIWKGLSETNRTRIEASYDEAIELDFPSTNIREFAKVLLNYQRKRGKPSSVSQNWVTRLVNTGMYSIALLKVDGRTVAAAMVKKFKDMVSFPWSCTLDAYPGADDLAYRLFWDLLVHCKDDGLRIFHSGRIPANHDAPGYRLGWGGVQNSYYYQYYGLKTTGESVAMVSRSRRVFESVWKRCPDAIAGLVGPAIVKQFP